MKKLILCYVLFLTFTQANCQNSYKVDLIPKPLLSKAGAVVRNSETYIEIKSIKEYIYRKKIAITVLNESGADESDIELWYDKTRKIKSIKGVIYNGKGVQVSKFSSKDFSDISAVSNGSLHEDSREKIFSAGLLIYPYTIEYEYEMRVYQSLAFPSWYPLYSMGTSIEKSSLSVARPFDFEMRFEEINFNGNKSESQQELITQTWSVSNIEAIKDEPFSPEFESFVTIINMSPEKFYYDGVTGNFSNWKEYGKWVNERLLKGRAELPSSTISEIKSITKNIDDPKVKAKIIYEYMQQKTRYISVQIGIGGFQPFPAADVDKFGYGDCKGLSNYTKALLKVVGIESYYTIVNAGRAKEDISASFTSISDGNHIILCLPFPNDTTWLECTNQDLPFGFLGDMTDDRIVLACTPEGGKLMRTTKYDHLKNKQTRKASFIINDNGDLKGKIYTTFEGTQYDNHEALAGEPFSEQVKLLADMYPFLNLKIDSINFNQDKQVFPVCKEIIVLSSGKFGAVSTSGMLISLNPINRTNFIPKEARNRIHPVYINRGFTDIDEITFEVPKDYKIDSFNKDISLEKQFGYYSTETTLHKKTITFKRTLIFKEGTYPVDQYEELVNFYKKIKEGDQSKVMLLKATL